MMNYNIMSLVHWPESEFSENISEQLDVNEVNEASEKHSNNEQNADESAIGQAEPPSKRKKADESAAPNKFLSSLEKKANTQEVTGPKINDTLASHVTSIMRQKPEEESEKNLFQKILRPGNCPGLSKITVNQVIWDRVSAEARTGDVKMQRVQSVLVKGTTNVALIADLVRKSSEDKGNIDTTALLDKLWKLTEDSLCCKIMLICVLKKSPLLILCSETMLPNKSKILQMIIKSPISCWTRIDHGTEANRGSGRVRAGFRASFFRGQGSTNRPLLRSSNQYLTTTYTKPQHNQETPKN